MQVLGAVGTARFNECSRSTFKHVIFYSCCTVDFGLIIIIIIFFKNFNFFLYFIFFQVLPGELTIVTGVPNSGKSEWIDALLCNLNHREGWRFALCSMENKVRLELKFSTYPDIISSHWKMVCSKVLLYYRFFRF